MPLTLPNNYTEYVPLDVLQASQLNNDNQNNQYIADHVPSTDAQTVLASTNGNGWITTALKSVMSVNLPAGTYHITGSTVFNGTGQSVVASLGTGLSGASDRLGQSQMATANGYYLTLCPFADVTLATATTVHLRLNHTGGNNADLWGTNSISYVRVK